jgi:hypothetical protein
MSQSSSEADSPAAGSNAGSSSRQLSTTVIDAAAPRARMGRIAIVALSLAAAAALGSVAGALAGSALSGGAPHQPVAPALNANAVNDRLAQLSSDVAALKSKLDSAKLETGTQFSRIAERLDRAEKAQAEPAAKLAAISETVERIERKSAAAADVTGSIVPKQQDRPPVVEGWVLREIDDGRALVQSRLGYFEVGPGSNLPGIGRVEGIRREDGRWVVVTAKGLIVSGSARR